ncbi:MAG: hypothetical protein M1348_02820 [Candidatus Parvarchaeota archaeon]|jgi:hypothetical protein|nr:hypothetical protein [Candidatus Parvarchaeota archaeon]
MKNKGLDKILAVKNKGINLINAAGRKIDNASYKTWKKVLYAIGYIIAPISGVSAGRLLSASNAYANAAAQYGYNCFTDSSMNTSCLQAAQNDYVSGISLLAVAALSIGMVSYCTYRDSKMHELKRKEMGYTKQTLLDDFESR